MKRILLLSILLSSTSAYAMDSSDELPIEMADLKDNSSKQFVQKKEKRCTPACRKTVFKGLGRVAVYALLVAGIVSGMVGVGESIHIKTIVGVQPHEKLIFNPYCHYEYKPEYQEPDFCEDKPCPNYTESSYVESHYIQKYDDQGPLVEVCEYPITYYSPSVASGVATDSQITPAAISTGVCLALLIGQAIADAIQALERY